MRMIELVQESAQERTIIKCVINWKINHRHLSTQTHARKERVDLNAPARGTRESNLIRSNQLEYKNSINYSTQMSVRVNVCADVDVDVCTRARRCACNWRAGICILPLQHTVRCLNIKHQARVSLTELSTLQVRWRSSWKKRKRKINNRQVVWWREEERKKKYEKRLKCIWVRFLYCGSLIELTLSLLLLLLLLVLRVPGAVHSSLNLLIDFAPGIRSLIC